MYIPIHLFLLAMIYASHDAPERLPLLLHQAPPKQASRPSDPKKIIGDAAGDFVRANWPSLAWRVLEGMGDEDVCGRDFSEWT